MPMRSCLQVLLRVLFVLGFGGVFTIMQRSEVKWDYLVYTQIWPETSCIEINETHSHGKCVMPAKVKTWTIHGLWPNVHGGKGPFYCNDSWPFRLDNVKDIQDDLEVHWPNLIAGESISSFWKHEWTKHGTCAASLPDLNSEHKYFALGLKLQQKFNLTEMLANSGIFPSLDKSMKLKNLRSAIESFTKSNTRILCMETKTKTDQILAQIEICLDKSFNTMDCSVPQYGSFNFKEKPRFARLRRSADNPDWDPYPFYPNFIDCKDELPIKYFPIKPTIMT